MKFRKDFVTNSSSSSYVCEICGAVESGMDASPYDLGMVECVNGHIICENESLPHPNKNQMIDEIIQNGWNLQRWVSWVGYRDFTREDLLELDEEDILYRFYKDEENCMPECICPICQFEEYSTSDMAAYLMKEFGVPREEVFAEIKKYNRRRKKLYDSEYITYVCQKHNLNPGEISGNWKMRFGSYADFKNYLKSTK